MAFQFLCPQGHLLEGDEAHMGLTTQCPHCGMTFIIPTIELRQPAPEPQSEPQFDVYSQPYVPEPASEVVVQQEVAPEPVTSIADELTGDAVLESAATNIAHIPCPNGHELETPLEMIGQEVLCPHCGVQFRLRNEDSLEYRVLREQIEKRQAELWFKGSIAAAVIVFLALLIMMIFVIIG